MPAAQPMDDKAKIEALLSHVGSLTGAVFIRNGTEYDAATAVKFLRRKWQANQAEIKTAPDFIKKAASFSSTTGKPYLIRLSDGVATPCAAYLTKQLGLLEASSSPR